MSIIAASYATKQRQSGKCLSHFRNPNRGTFLQTDLKLCEANEWSLEPINLRVAKLPTITDCWSTLLSQLVHPQLQWSILAQLLGRRKGKPSSHQFAPPPQSLTVRSLKSYLNTWPPRSKVWNFLSDFLFRNNVELRGWKIGFLPDDTGDAMIFSFEFRQNFTRDDGNTCRNSIRNCWTVPTLVMFSSPRIPVETCHNPRESCGKHLMIL